MATFSDEGFVFGTSAAALTGILFGNENRVFTLVVPNTPADNTPLFHLGDKSGDAVRRFINACRFLHGFIVDFTGASPMYCVEMSFVQSEHLRD
jgi:hypothetical protein